ncbi:NAD(P)-dependent alcohol dehydrogenase [Modestobacter sp. SYSU DS0511]
MKAIVRERYGAADVLAVADVDEPPIRAHEVLVRVRAAGIDRGVWHLMTGTPYLLRLGTGLRRPRTRLLGVDVAGTVVAVGDEVTGAQPGDEVFGSCSGSFAEYAAVPGDRCTRKPAELGFAQAAALPSSSVTALQALRDQGRVQPGQRVLVIGAGGGVGTYAVQLAAAFGAQVTGVCSTPKVELVRSLGADEVIDYTQEELTGRYDLVLDIAGNRTLRRLRRLLTPRGTLVIVGGEGGGRWTGGLDRQLRAVLWSLVLRQRMRFFVSTARRADLEAVREYVGNGQVTPALDRTIALGDVPRAMRDLERGLVRGKAVVAL